MLPSGWTKPVPGAVGDTTRRVPNESDSPVPMTLHLLPSPRYPWVEAVVCERSPLPSTVICIPVVASTDGKPSAACRRGRVGAGGRHVSRGVPAPVSGPLPARVPCQRSFFSPGDPPPFFVPPKRGKFVESNGASVTPVLNPIPPLALTKAPLGSPAPVHGRVVFFAAVVVLFGSPAKSRQPFVSFAAPLVIAWPPTISMPANDS